MGERYNRSQILNHLKSIKARDVDIELSDSKLADMLNLSRQSVFQFRQNQREDINTLIMYEYINVYEDIKAELELLKKKLNLYKKASEKSLRSAAFYELEKLEESL